MLFYGVNKRKRGYVMTKASLLSLVIILNMALDYIFYLEQYSAAGQIVRVGLNMAYLLYAVYWTRDAYHVRWTIFYVTAVYWFVLLLGSSNYGKSFAEYLKVMIGLSYILAGYAACDKYEDLFNLIKKLYPIVPIYLGMVIVANFFGWGDDSYIGEDSAKFNTALGDAKLYAPAFMVALTPIVLAEYRSKIYKVGISLLSLACVLVLILTLRRTAIFIMVAFGSLYWLMIRDYKMLWRVALIMSVALVFVYDDLSSLLTERLESREYLISEQYSISDEGRFQEFGGVMDTLASKNSINNYLFGYEPFNTSGAYGIYSTRPIHVDYTYFFFSTGLVGLALYLSIHIGIFAMVQSARIKNDAKNLRPLFYSFFVVVLIVGLSGNVWAITYKSYAYALIGGMLGSLTRDKAR